MKKAILSLLTIAFSIVLSAQTATNFTCNDCKGTSYDLFTELASGKVVVLCWVMPCGPCVGPSLTTYNVVQSFSSSHPGQVVFYLCDDYADTPCASLTSWANTYGMTQLTLFSNDAIKMEDYGTPGMPKIVVIAPDHSVQYNANNSVNATALQNAINTSLTFTSVAQANINKSSLNIFPNPIRDKSFMQFTTNQPSQVEIDLLSPEGSVIAKPFSGWLSTGEHTIETQIPSLNPGVYFIRLNDGQKKELVKIVVTR
jgi:hypothetical protein